MGAESAPNVAKQTAQRKRENRMVHHTYLSLCGVADAVEEKDQPTCRGSRQHYCTYAGANGSRAMLGR